MLYFINFHFFLRVFLQRRVSGAVTPKIVNLNDGYHLLISIGDYYYIVP